MAENKTKKYKAKRNFGYNGIVAKAGEVVELTEDQAKAVKEYIEEVKEKKDK